MNPNFDGVKYFLNIPAFVAHDSRLKDPEKLLFGEIFSMLNTTGKFFMNNPSVALRLNKTVRAIQTYLSALEKLGYIKRSLIIDEKTKEVKGRFIQLGDEYHIQFEKMKHDLEVDTLKNELAPNSSVVSISDLSRKRGGEQDCTRGVNKSTPGGGEQDCTRVTNNSSGGGEQDCTYNRTLLKEHTKRTTTPPLPPKQVDNKQTFGNGDDGVVDKNDRQQQPDQTQSLELRFKQLWAKYPAKIGYNEAFAAYRSWVQASPNNTDEYLDKRLEKYLQHLAMNQWLIAMRPQKWFGGGFQDDYSYYDQPRPSQGAPGRKQGGRIKEQLPEWAQNQQQTQEQVTPEQIAQAKEALAKLRSTDKDQQEKR
ncbi:helix-turn-helix domain-containing protein [Limosilactobacillus fermentum]|nr:helix-turn-helix domain-containing protein [Limosilactobacillus fermentum]MBN2942096.1 helix-turn-helix domain-containing protein [Streptococcus sp.]SPE16713.1 hypothetical protein LAF9269_01755 [Limosilactobacillus fermentum]